MAEQPFVFGFNIRELRLQGQEFRLVGLIFLLAGLLNADSIYLPIKIADFVIKLAVGIAQQQEYNQHRHKLFDEEFYVPFLRHRLDVLEALFQVFLHFSRFFFHICCHN